MSATVALAAFAQGDPQRGAGVFQQCAACHSITPGEQMTGPSLAKVWHRKAGTEQGFRRYSEAMQHANVVWNETTLDKWLANPDEFMPGTTMTFPGLREARARADVIAYLKAVSEGTAPAAASRGGGVMGMQSARIDLKSAPPEAQVTAVQHCGDTYTIGTADGKANKVWEFNLRIKTDSSRFGPNPGKPVIVGSGMQGDRASLVFSAPAEISRFIIESCR
jgi:cytochrome c